ncbi:MAG: class I SAM-dependent DNA methyltransferase [Clostridia bacterium]|nr:class I SAM-dependent DNA methyltransferase [Clostridia bacterium]
MTRVLKPFDLQALSIFLCIKVALVTDPAAGSGNFLTETYLSLRKLENRVIEARLRTGDTLQLGMSLVENPVKVSISQFYGIEINDFAVTVAKTALWIAESQMLRLTENIVHMPLDFLPLKTNATIVEGNALRMDWEQVVPKERLNYIMGNPPFVGHQWRSQAQTEDMEVAFYDLKKHGKLDYVAAWYQKAANYMKETRIQAAFVSTNSITQGESVGILWKFLFDQKNVEIQFAYRTFVWTSEAADRAAVHCVIIGFTCYHDERAKKLYDQGGDTQVQHINGYLLDAPDVFIEARGKQLTTGLPEMSKGSQPTDGGYLILSPDERDLLVRQYPEAGTMIKRFVGSRDLINDEYRYCLWLKGIPPIVYRKITPIMERLENVAKERRKSPTISVQRDAGTPMLFTQIRQPDTDYLAVPEVSSQNRRYIPIGFLDPTIVASNKLYLVPDATLFMFGVMMSNVHMAWMRVVCGRLKSDYSYSPAVYNNFPWPDATDEQKAKIETTAQAILDARALYPDSSLADLYDELTMPPELRTAHQNNDRAVMEAYGMKALGPDGKYHWLSESEVVAELMRRYQALTAKQN